MDRGWSENRSSDSCPPQTRRQEIQVPSLPQRRRSTSKKRRFQAERRSPAPPNERTQLGTQSQMQGTIMTRLTLKIFDHLHPHLRELWQSFVFVHRWR